MDYRLLVFALCLSLACLFAHPGCAQTTAEPQWQLNTWQRGCASLDLDFYNDRYYINDNTTCDGTVGTIYTSSGVTTGGVFTPISGNTGVQNFITGVGATFTRAGTNSITDTNPPFYLNTSLDSFASRASVTNNVTSTFAPFFIGTTGNGPSQSFVSRADSSKIATYFNSSGTLTTVSSNGAARSNAYYYNGSSWVLGGTLIEAAATNSIRNNTMAGAAASSSSTQLISDGSFTSCSGSTCTGWTTTVNGGTGTVSFSPGAANLTGDGTNAASIYQAITTVSGYTYTIAVTTGSGNSVTVQAGTTAGGSNLLAANAAPASTTTSYQFTATGTSSYVQFNNVSTAAATITTVSVVSAGKVPTNWAISAGNGVLWTIIGTGTEDGISYADINFSGTTTALTNCGVNFETNTAIAANIGQTWTGSVYVELTSGSWGTYNQTPQLSVVERTSGGSINGYSPTLFSPLPTGAALSTQRYTNSREISYTSSAYVTMNALFQYAAGQTVNFTVRLGMPQLELNPNSWSTASGYATSVIATSSAAVTRAADVYNQQPASYFDSGGNLWFAATNTARTNYYHTGGSWVLGGTLIEPAATNSIRNNMMMGAVAADGVERTNNGTFSNTSPNTCSGSVTSGGGTLTCNNGSGTGWVGTVNGGTGTVSAATGAITLTGDGTNAASIYEAITTVSGYLYTIVVTTGSGNAVTVQVGSTAGGSDVLAANTVAASTTTSYQFQAGGTTSYVQINNVSTTAATVTIVSVQSAGHIPTNWQLGYGNGIAATVKNVSTQNGVAFIDVQYQGTATATATASLWFDTTSGIAALNGQAWDESLFVAISGGSLTNVNSSQLGWYLYSSTPTYLLSQQIANIQSSLNSTLTQYSQTATISNASTAYIRPYFFIAYSSGAAINVTIRIGMPQLEQSSYATSVIPTFGSAVTRTADVYSVPDGGTYFNSSGVLTQAGVSVPRLDHNPVSPFLPMGLLMENNETNYITYSVPDGGTNWSYTANNTVGTANATTAPDGTTTAASMADTSSSTTHYATPTAAISVTSGTQYDFSVFVKAGTATDVQLVLPSPPFTSVLGNSTYTNFNLTTGTIASGCTSCATIQALSNGWYRISLTQTASSTASGSPLILLTNNSTSGGLEPSYSGSGETLYIWGAQLEAAQMPTSYIPTSGSSVARAQDVFTVPGTAGGGSGWISNDVGTFSTVGSVLYESGGVQAFASIDDGTGVNSFYEAVNVNQKRTAVLYESGNQYVGLLSPNTAYTLGNTTKIVVGYSSTLGTEGGATDNAGFNDGNYTLPTTQNRLNIGAGRASLYPLDGWVQRIWYMPIDQPDAALVNYSQ